MFYILHTELSIVHYNFKK